MRNIKVSIVTLTIILLAANSFQGVAMAAQVSGINKSKGRIHINGGVNDGFIPGATVCFIVSSASYGDEFVCGSVVSAEASKAVVKVQKSRARKMKMGTEAMLHVEKEAKEEVENVDMVKEKAKEETKEKEDPFR